MSGQRDWAVITPTHLMSGSIPAGSEVKGQSGVSLSGADVGAAKGNILKNKSPAVLPASPPYHGGPHALITSALII